MGFRQPWHRIARSRIAGPARRSDGLPERLCRIADRAHSAYFRGRDPASGWAVRIALRPSESAGRRQAPSESSGNRFALWICFSFAMAAPDRERSSGEAHGAVDPPAIDSARQNASGADELNPRVDFLPVDPWASFRADPANPFQPRAATECRFADACVCDLSREWYRPGVSDLGPLGPCGRLGPPATGEPSHWLRGEIASTGGQGCERRPLTQSSRGSSARLRFALAVATERLRVLRSPALDLRASRLAWPLLPSACKSAIRRAVRILQSSRWRSAETGMGLSI